jgi:hypothetical protein
LYRLTEKITSFDDKEFETMSDKQGAEEVAMHLLVDNDARFTISSTFTAKAPYLNLPPGWEDWDKNWTHDVLAQYITLLWGQTIERMHVPIRDKIADYDLQLNTSKMNIENFWGEEEVMGGIVTIFARQPTKNLPDEVKQEGWVKIYSRISLV